MNVRELIAALQKLPQNLSVVVRGYECGVNDIRGFREVHLIRDHYKDIWYNGQHEITLKNEGERAIELWGDNEALEASQSFKKKE